MQRSEMRQYGPRGGPPGESRSNTLTPTRTGKTRRGRRGGRGRSLSPRPCLGPGVGGTRTMGQTAGSWFGMQAVVGHHHAHHAAPLLLSSSCEDSAETSSTPTAAWGHQVCLFLYLCQRILLAVYPRSLSDVLILTG